MRRLSAFWLLLALAACGGSTPTNPPPPPPPAPGPPASLTVQAGDGQQAEPGFTLPVKPAVLVKDASGRPVTGVAVAFAVDSGNGSLSAGSSTTGSDGIASVTWTMGPTEGSNVLVATVSGLPPARVRAQAKFQLVTLLDQSAVPASGGTVTFAHPGDAFDGLSITVPGGAFASETRFTVQVAPGVKPSLPADVTQLGPAILVTDGKGFGDLPMALRLPLHAGGDTVIAAFFFDPGSGTLENIPLVSRDDASITVATSHFSADQLMLRDGNAGLRALASPVSAPAAAFGQVYIIGLATTPAALSVPLSTGFAPGVDDWEFSNLGTYPALGGICAGMSITAMYYFYRFRPGGRPLFHQYDVFQALEYDNPLGERLATVIQKEMNGPAARDALIALIHYAQSSKISYDQLVYQSLAFTIKVTHLPQYLSFRSDNSGGHAVVAYAVNNGTVSFADPNFPGMGRQLHYSSGQFAPVSLKLKSTDPADIMPYIHLLGVSSMIPMRKIDQHWNEFTAHNVGSLYFPDLRIEIFDRLAKQWVPVPSSNRIQTTSRDLAIRTICPQCISIRPTMPGQRGITFIRDTTNLVRGRDDFDTDTASVFVFGRGPGNFRMSVESHYYDVVAKDWGFVDQRFVTITALPFSISPRASTGAVNANLSFFAENAGQGGPGWTFTWDFNDNTAPVSKVGDSTVVHQWTAPGIYTIKAELRDPTGTLVGKDQTTVTIVVPKPAWRLTDLTKTGEGGPVPTGGSVNITFMNKLVGDPSLGVIYVHVTTLTEMPGNIIHHFTEIGMQMTAPGAPPDLLAGVQIPLGFPPEEGQCDPANCPGYGLIITGDAASGTITGAWGGSNSISAQKNGIVLTGTFHLSETDFLTHQTHFTDWQFRAVSVP